MLCISQHLPRSHKPHKVWHSHPWITFNLITERHCIIYYVFIFILSMTSGQADANFPRSLEERFKAQQAEIDALKQQLLSSASNCDSNNVEDKQQSRETSEANFQTFLQDWISRQGLAPATVQTPANPIDASITRSIEEDSQQNDDSTIHDIHQPCVDTLWEWFRNVHTGAEIQEVLKMCLRPANCDPLLPVSINPKVARSMDRSKSDEFDDQRLKWLCNGLVKASQPLATAWSELLRLEYSVRKAKFLDFDTNQDEEIYLNPPDAFVQMDDDNDFNISEVIRHVKLALKTTGFRHVQAVQKGGWIFRKNWIPMPRS